MDSPNPPSPSPWRTRLTHFLGDLLLFLFLFLLAFLLNVHFHLVDELAFWVHWQLGLNFSHAFSVIVLSLLPAILFFAVRTHQINQQLLKRQGKLERCAQEAASLQENVDVGLLRLNDKGGVVYANPAALRLTGLDEEALKTTPPASWLTWGEHPRGELPRLSPGAPALSGRGTLLRDGLSIPTLLTLARENGQEKNPLTLLTLHPLPEGLELSPKEIYPDPDSTANS